ncbi:DUF4190 domain-containing protein [Streptomyces adelaidensis]|uniref:DUF4190 domain-containing protein n=1 Tax=Streptomyces adelaidensis TaxID=2796465 RepID=UPI001907C7A4|nr:DUF4190 domain-containing protein [Streptomyces adelaidensis]
MATPPHLGPQPPHGGGPFPPSGQPQAVSGQAYPYQVGPQPWGQAWGQGYPVAQPPRPVNGLAIAGLVLGVLCFLPGVGLFLGIVALVQIRKKGERGKGMAVAGIVLSTVGALLMTLAFTTGGARDAWDGFRDAANDTGTAFAVDKGDCFDTPSGSLESYAYDVDIVPCDGEHDAEVFANFSMPEGAFPGDDAVTDAADEQCYARSETYAMDTWALPFDADVYYFTPTRQSWRLGDRLITCMFGNMDPEATLTGSLRQDETTLDDDQFAYLEADAILNEAYDGLPEAEYVEDDLAGHKVWASRVVQALERQTRALRAHDWEPSAEEAVTDYAEGLDKARDEWAAASKASDAEVFTEHWDKAHQLTDGPKAVTAREALGLAAESPTYDAEDTGEDGGGNDSGTEV